MCELQSKANLETFHIHRYYGLNAPNCSAKCKNWETKTLYTVLQCAHCKVRQIKKHFVFIEYKVWTGPIYSAKCYNWENKDVLHCFTVCALQSKANSETFSIHRFYWLNGPNYCAKCYNWETKTFYTVLQCAHCKVRQIRKFVVFIDSMVWTGLITV